MKIENVKTKFHAIQEQLKKRNAVTFDDLNKPVMKKPKKIKKNAM